MRCPTCGYTGNADLFLSGCPNCGYANRTEADDAKGRGGRKKTMDDFGPDVEHYDFEAISGVQPLGTGKKVHIGLPSWFYPVAGVVLLLCFLALVIVYLALFRS